MILKSLINFLTKVFLTFLDIFKMSKIRFSKKMIAKKRSNSFYYLYALNAKKMIIIMVWFYGKDFLRHEKWQFDHFFSKKNFWKNANDFLFKFSTIFTFFVEINYYMVRLPKKSRKKCQTMTPKNANKC